MSAKSEDEAAKAALRQIAMGIPAPPFTLPNPHRRWWQIWKPRRVVFSDVTPDDLRRMLAAFESENQALGELVGEPLGELPDSHLPGSGKNGR